MSVFCLFVCVCVCLMGVALNWYNLGIEVCKTIKLQALQQLVSRCYQGDCQAKRKLQNFKKPQFSMMTPDF